ncbi:MAG: phosphoribosylformylglycinamidine synthase subunit PurS [bacterium]
MKKYSAKIYITLREGILDVQGKTVEHALHSISFDTLSDLKIGKFIRLTAQAENINDARKLIDDACKQLIANPIIEDYQIDLEEI